MFLGNLLPPAWEPQVVPEDIAVVTAEPHRPAVWDQVAVLLAILLAARACKSVALVVHTLRDRCHTAPNF